MNPVLLIIVLTDNAELLPPEGESELDPEEEPEEPVEPEEPEPEGEEEEEESEPEELDEPEEELLAIAASFWKTFIFWISKYALS